MSHKCENYTTCLCINLWITLILGKFSPIRNIFFVKFDMNLVNYDLYWTKSILKWSNMIHCMPLYVYIVYRGILLGGFLSSRQFRGFLDPFVIYFLRFTGVTIKICYIYRYNKINRDIWAKE